ncbi:MAG TPA: hypothetical protein VLS49_15800 [Usitatibacter sp.]|nr:hypothetical protein [Usitatibacter sp.]
MLGFFQLAVVGPIVGPRFGLSRACVDCTESREGRAACQGFGPGCIGAPQGEPAFDAQSLSSRIKR